MIEPGAPLVSRLSPVRCGRCSRPVTHMNKSVPGAEAGGLCKHCTREQRVEVWTYCTVVDARVVTHTRKVDQA